MELKITKEETSPLEVTLTIELESSDVEPFLDKAYRRVSNRVQIPGFRPGKAPRAIVENHVGRDALVRDSLESILQDSLGKAVEEEDLHTFGEPGLELVTTDPVSFKAVLSLEPVVDLGDFRSIRLEPEPVEVTGDEVDKVIEQLRYDSAPWEPADRPVQFGDLATLDVQGVIEGDTMLDDKDVDFIPDKDNNAPFPGFSVYLEGTAKGEDKEFTLPVPNDYRDSSIAGKECHFKVKVKELKHKLLADVDDEFAKGIGEGHESLEALRAKVVEDLKSEAERTAERSFQEKSFEELLKGVTVETSDLTINREIDRLMEEQSQALKNHKMDMDSYLKSVGKSIEELRDEARIPAQERLKRALVLRDLAEEEGIEVAPEEIDAEVASLTSGVSGSSSQMIEALNSENARGSIGSAIFTRKVLERLTQIVQAKDGAEEAEPQSTEEQPAST